MLESSVDIETRKNYGAGLLRFTQFCDKFQIPEDQRVPATEQLLSLFVADAGASKVTAKTVSSWLTGLKMWHVMNGTDWKGGELLKRAKKGVAKLAPNASTPAKEPATYEHMLALRHKLNLANTRDAAIWGATSTAFKDCTRLGELLPKTRSSFNAKKNVTRGCPVKRGNTASGKRRFVQFKIPWSKTTGFKGAWISLQARMISWTVLQHLNTTFL
ncbi:hypothetical protein GALMADRAFT_137530 [Galerina marginata CBS 339.88]|uniref:Core-binding (CB) domain-containing protein n=1 Tax=Galerina marginata (strain CBS 339.88) TaxID=685588 RepID=A0A067T808_GALM3|nr:hypothetical protein GALMADRAFT_137530 [Galerina marginata CBS 339.88]